MFLTRFFFFRILHLHCKAAGQQLEPRDHKITEELQVHTVSAYHATTAMISCERAELGQQPGIREAAKNHSY